MLPEGTVHKIFELGMAHGADFAEVFAEDSESSSIDLLDRKIDGISSGNSFGVGVRLLYGDEAYYGYSSDAAEAALLQLTENLAQAHRERRSGRPARSARRRRRTGIARASIRSGCPSVKGWISCAAWMRGCAPRATSSARHCAKSPCPRTGIKALFP